MKATKLAARARRKPAEDKERRIDRLYRKDWNPRRVLAGYFSVYITEGMVRSIMFILPLYLLTAIAGLSTLQIGFILIMAYVPWHFKFLLGFGMDRCGSIGSWRRRIYIILGTFITVAGVLWLSNTTQLWFGILPAIIMVMGGDALIDTGMDALLLDVTPPDWHGTGIGIGWGARAIGYTLSLVLTMIVHSLWGWGPVLYLFALYALPALLAIVIHEPACSSERQISRRSLAETFTDRRIVGWIGFAFLGAFVYVLDPTRGFLALIINPITGGGSATIFSAGIAFGLFAAAASFITGRLIDRIGHKRGYFISLALAFLAVLLWALVPPADMPGLVFYSAILGTFSAFCMVSWFSVLADTVPPNFTAFMWQYDMGYLHVAAFVSGIIIGVLGTGQLALLGLGLLMLLGFVPAKLIRSSRNSKGEIS